MNLKNISKPEMMMLAGKRKAKKMAMGGMVDQGGQEAVMDTGIEEDQEADRAHELLSVEEAFERRNMSGVDAGMGMAKGGMVDCYAEGGEVEEGETMNEKIGYPFGKADKKSVSTDTATAMAVLASKRKKKPDEE